MWFGWLVVHPQFNPRIQVAFLERFPTPEWIISGTILCIFDYFSLGYLHTFFIDLSTLFFPHFLPKVRVEVTFPFVQFDFKALIMRSVRCKKRINFMCVCMD